MRASGAKAPLITGPGADKSVPFQNPTFTTGCEGTGAEFAPGFYKDRLEASGGMEGRA
jgi:hypothetical protein